VLLHGFGAHRATWDGWLPELERRHRVVAVDLIGCGNAPKPKGADYRPEAQAAAVRDLVRHLDLRDVTLIGHSLGGGIALLTALHLLDDGEGRLAGLVSVAGAAFRQRDPPFIRLARHEGLSRVLLELLPRGWLIRTAMRQIVAVEGAVTPERVAAYSAPLRSAATRAALVRQAACAVPDDLDGHIARYPEIGVPALCLWGREDRVVPPWVGERLARTLPDAMLVFIDKCGHLPMDERPRESVAALLDFLEARVADGPGASPPRGGEG
jgi:pimeloyl-ACP methyl ester carboxylesterase